MNTLAALALGAFLVIVGTTNFIIPNYYVRLVPPVLPHPRVLVLVSGVVEVAVGAGLLVDATRTFAAWAAAGLMAVYVLTHVDALRQASVDQRHFLQRPAGAAARVAVNAGYLAWALAVALTT